MGEKAKVTWLEKYASDRSKVDPDFKSGFEEESALLELVRARNSAEMTQQELADALHVSQPYIAQIERGSKPMSASLMFKYAAVVGAKIEIVIPNLNKETSKALHNSVRERRRP